MTEDKGSAPAADPAPDAEGPASAATADGDVAASAGSGNAPGPGGDAQAESSGEATPAQVSAAYRILNREFRDQKHAEEVLGAELGRTRGLQKQITERDAELQALRQLLTTRGGGQVQGSAQEPGTTPGPQTIAEEVAEEAELYNKIAQDPEMGIGHALYAMAQKFDERLDAMRDELLTGTITPYFQQQSNKEAVARVLTAAQQMSKDFPEIQEYENPPPEIAEAQQEILGIIQGLAQTSPEWLVNQPREALWYAVSRYRDRHGTPVLAQAPGTSGSPSAIASAAAEAAAQASAATPLDGSGVPPQRSKVGPETLTERWKREAAQLPKEATTPSGRKLGFSESA